MEQNQSQSDHDTLIKIETKLDLLTAEVKIGNDDTKQRITILGENKVEKDEFHQWQITHERETQLREQALAQSTQDSFRSAMDAARGNSEEIASLKESDAAQSRQLQYMAGGLVVFGIALSLVGPLVTAWLGRLLRIN